MDAGTEQHGASAERDAPTQGDVVLDGDRDMTLSTELGAFLHQIADIASVLESGIVDPTSVNWADIKRRAKAFAEEYEGVGHTTRRLQHIYARHPHTESTTGKQLERNRDANALRGWMRDNGHETYTDVAAWLNQKIAEITGSKGKYTGSQVGVWANARRAVPSTVHSLFWPGSDQN